MKREELLEIAKLAVIGYACFALYPAVGWLAGHRGVDYGPLLRTRFDDAIPYIPVLVLPYALAFVTPLATAAAVAVHGGLAEFRRVLYAYLGLLLLHFAFYLAFPTSASGIMLPEGSFGPGFLGWAVHFFHHVAPPWNAFPSFHVAGAWFFYRILHRWAPRASAVYAVWFWVMAFSISAIKIHWFLDGVAGFAVAELWFRWVYLPRAVRAELSYA